MARAAVRNSWMVLVPAAALGTGVALTAVAGFTEPMRQVATLAARLIGVAIPLALLASTAARPDRRGLHDRLSSTTVRPVAPMAGRVWVLAALVVLAGAARFGGWWFAPPSGTTGRTIDVDADGDPVACDISWDAWYALSPTNVEVVLGPQPTRRELRVGPHDLVFEITDSTGAIDFAMGSRSLGSSSGSGTGKPGHYEYTKTGEGLGTFHMACMPADR